MTDESQCAVHCISFNARQDCFVLAADDGVRVFAAEPLAELRRLPASLVGSVRRCALLHRSNLLALVGGGRRPKFAENTVMVWDDIRGQFILELTFASPVQEVLLATDKLAAVLPRQVHVFSPFPHPSPRLVAGVELGHARCCALAPQPAADGRHLLVAPAARQGAVLLLDVSDMPDGGPSSASRVPALIDAHQSELTAVALSNDSQLLATGSQLGTVIRLWDVRSRSVIREMRRGTDPVNLYCLRFSPDASFLGVSSDKSTVHIFAVRAPAAGRKTLLHAVGLAADEGRERSTTQFSLGVDDPRAQVGFAAGAVLALCLRAGAYHKFALEMGPAGAPQCTRAGYDLLLQLSADAQFWQVDA